MNISLLSISSVTPTGVLDKHKSVKYKFYNSPTGVLDEYKSVKYKFCNSYGSPG